MKKIGLLISTLLLIGILATGCGKQEVGILGEDNSSGSSVENTDTTTEDNTAVVTDETEKDEVENVTADTEEKTEDDDGEDENENVLPLVASLPDGRGNEIQFSDYKGKLLFVNFFGTWCTYCMQEMPDFQKFTENYADQATIVIVNALETENTDMAGVLKWYEDNEYTMQLVFDEDRSRTKEYYGAIQGFPTTFVYDAEQNFLGYIPGMMDYAMLENILNEYGQ